jgi:uncharacterized membrane protein (UPF0127 family)
MKMFKKILDTANRSHLRIEINYANKDRKRSMLIIMPQKNSIPLTNTEIATQTVCAKIMGTTMHTLEVVYISQHLVCDTRPTPPKKKKI